MFNSPASIAEMMRNAADAIKCARDEGVKVGLIDVPLPEIGATELDAWPGGIKQKYSVLYPMLQETMSALGFPPSAASKREYLSSPETGESGEDDAVGVWSHDGVYLCTFPTPEYIPSIQTYERWADAQSIFAVVNQQFFLDPMSKGESKTFLKEAVVVYRLESLNMKGPGALPVRGVLYRQYPHQFKAARRLDGGGYVVLKSFDTLPTRDELERLFFDDSKERDKSLTFLDRLKKQIPRLG